MMQKLESHIHKIPKIPERRLRIVRFYPKSKKREVPREAFIRQFFTNRQALVILPEMAVDSMFNPFALITKPIAIVTNISARTCDLLFIAFVAIPVCLCFGGPRFTLESLNCLSGIFWFAIPLFMIVFSFFSLSWWRFTSSLAFAGIWVPICLVSFVVWMPLLEGAENNKYPFVELIETKKADHCTDECRYRITFNALGPMGIRRTRETRFVPGLKWIEITDQQVLGISSLNKLSSLNKILQ